MHLYAHPVHPATLQKVAPSSRFIGEEVKVKVAGLSVGFLTSTLRAGQEAPLAGHGCAAPLVDTGSDFRVISRKGRKPAHSRDAHLSL